LSAGHTKEDLDWALRVLDEVGDKLILKYGTIDVEEKHRVRVNEVAKTLKTD